MSEKVATGEHHLKDCAARNRPFGEKVLARHVSTDPMNRIDPRYSAEMLHWTCRRCVQRYQKVGTAEQMGRCDWSAVEVDRRQVDSGQVRSSRRSNSHPIIAACRSTESQSKMLMSSEPLWDAQGAARSRTTNVNKPTQIVAE